MKMSEAKTIIREYDYTDSEAVRLILNEIFPSYPLDRETWETITAKDFTAAVAEVNGEIVGSIPLKKFNFVVAPGKTVTAWAEFRVGVDSKYRGKGIGHQLQDGLKKLLKGRADMIIIRSARENSGPAQFYFKNGFREISMPLRFVLEGKTSFPTPGKVMEISEEEFLERNTEWYSVLEQCYAETGGYVSRHGSYRIDALATMGKFARSKHFMLVKQAGEITGYGVAFGMPWGNILMEYAFTGNFRNGFRELLNAMLGKLGTLHLHATNQSRVYDCLIEAGYSHEPRSWGGGNPVTAFIVDSDSLARKVMAPLPGLEKLSIKVWNSENEEIIFTGSAPEKIVTLEMKDYHLPRLLTRRLDLKHAIEHEEITCFNASAADISLISQAFAPTAWSYFELDNI